MNWCRQQFQT